MWLQPDRGNIADGAYEVDCRLTSGCGDLNVTGVANGVSEGRDASQER